MLMTTFEAFSLIAQFNLSSNSDNYNDRDYCRLSKQKEIATLPAK